MKTIPGFLAIALLALPGLQAAAQEGAFTVPALEFGAQARYRLADAPGGPPAYLDFTIGPDARILNRAAEEISTYQVRVQAGTTAYNLHLATRSMLLERADSACVADACGDPRVHHDWFVHNVPALFGATALQGRTLRVGDAWTLDAQCPSCDAPLRFTVEPPTATSPPGTAYTVRITGGYGGAYATSWLMPQGRIHMGTEHAFPLRVEHPQMRGPANLVRADPGASALPSQGFAPTRYDAPLAAVPPAGGYPAEGAPLADWPSWSAARDATGTQPEGTFRSVALHKSGTRVALPGGTVLEPEADYVYEERWVRPGADDRLTTYWGNRTLLTGVTHPFEWTAAASLAARSGGGCVLDTVPLYDGVRHALQVPGVLSGAYGIDLLVHDCGSAYLTVDGWGGEALTLDARTGLLLFAWDAP